MAYTLTYFDMAGRGEMCRIALHHAGILTDNRLSFAEFGAAKAQGKYALGVPTLTLVRTYVMSAAGLIVCSFPSRRAMRTPRPILQPCCSPSRVCHNPSASPDAGLPA